jgi:hypothetical protein
VARCPREVLLKFKPEMEQQAESAAIASSRAASAPMSNEAGTSMMPACCTGEPEDIEVVIRIKLSANDAALVGPPCLEHQAVIATVTANLPKLASTPGKF